MTATRPLDAGLKGLPAATAVRVRRALGRMELGNLGDHEPVGQGAYEHRIHFGPGYRVWFGREGAARVIPVGGGAKARQSQDIAHARRLWELYKERRRRESR